MAGVTAGMYGGHLEQLSGMGTKFGQQSEAVIALKNDINSSVESTCWEGPVADRFRASWRDEFMPALDKLTAALQEASKHISDRTEAIRVATA